MIVAPIFSASTGGTAFPTCLNCSVIGPENSKESGKDWILAASLTVNVLSSQGWMNVYPSLARWATIVGDGRSHLILLILSLNPSCSYITHLFPLDDWT